MRRYLPLLAALTLACGDAEPTAVGPIEVEYGMVPEGDEDFTIRAENYFGFGFDADWVDDYEPRADSVYGSGRWVPGDRSGYTGAYATFQHQDPGFHGPVDVLRMSFVKIAQAAGGVGKITSYGFDEFEVEPGLLPYPYELDPDFRACQMTKQGGTVGLFHHRGGTLRQLLMIYEIPAVSPDNPALTWWYQGSGEFCGVVGGQPVISVQFAGFHNGPHGEAAGVNEVYQFCVGGVDTWRCVPTYASAVRNGNRLPFPPS